MYVKKLQLYNNYTTSKMHVPFILFDEIIKFSHNLHALHTHTHISSHILISPPEIRICVAHVDENNNRKKRKIECNKKRRNEIVCKNNNKNVHNVVRFGSYVIHFHSHCTIIEFDRSHTHTSKSSSS